MPSNFQMEHRPFELPGLNYNLTTLGWQCTKELKIWTDELGLRYPYPLLTRMLPLLKVVVNPAMLQAAMPYWDPIKTEFRFGNLSLCPTLEDICHILSLSIHSFDGEIAVPLPEQGYRNYLAKFLGLRGTEPFVKPYEKNDLKISYDYMYHVARTQMPRFGQKYDTKELQVHQRRYIACFFGEVLFGKTSDSMDPIIVKAVEGFTKEQHIVPLVLGELIRNLNKGEEFAGSAIIFYIWICEHLPISLPRPQDLPDWRSFYEEHIPARDKRLCDQWGEMKSSDITWRMTSVMPSFIVGHKGPQGWFQSDLVILPTFGEIVGYRPLRFVRQFGYVQGQPLSRVWDFGHKHIVPNRQDIAARFQKRWKTLCYSYELSGPFNLKTSVVPKTTPEYDSWLTD